MQSNVLPNNTLQLARRVRAREEEFEPCDLSINVTLDGCCDHTEVIADDELHRYATELLDDSDGVLFGRVTNELFERYWPSVASSASGTKAEIDFARKLNNKRKYVVSATLDKVQWDNSFLIKGDLAQEVSS